MYSSFHEGLHDTLVLFSWEGGALVDHVQFYSKLIDFFPEGLDPRVWCKAAPGVIVVVQRAPLHSKFELRILQGSREGDAEG